MPSLPISDKLTIFTFSQPVELPGVSLPAGTYTFKVLDSLADRNIVQVWDKDQKKLYGTFLAIPDYTPNPSNKTIIKFSERTPGAPKAVKEWFYPGESMGWEFVYPKKRAMELAKASNQSVPSMPNNLASNITQPAQSSSDSSVAAMKNAPIVAEKPNGDEAEVAHVFIIVAPVGNDANSQPNQHNVNNDADEAANNQRAGRVARDHRGSPDALKFDRAREDDECSPEGQERAGPPRSCSLCPSFTRLRSGFTPLTLAGNQAQENPSSVRHHPGSQPGRSAGRRARPPGPFRIRIAKSKL